MLQWFLIFSEFPDFTEFNESSAPFRENSIDIISVSYTRAGKTRIVLVKFTLIKYTN